MSNSSRFVAVSRHLNHYISSVWGVRCPNILKPVAGIFYTKALEIGDIIILEENILTWYNKTIDLSSYTSELGDYTIKFEGHVGVVEDINLKKIPKEEHELLIVLGKQLYSFVEMRFYVSNEPSWGECQGNSMWQTRIPK